MQFISPNELLTALPPVIYERLAPRLQRVRFGADPTWKNKGEAKAARDRRRIAVREGREDKAEADTNFKAFVEDRFLPHIETNKSPGTYQSYKYKLCSSSN